MSGLGVALDVVPAEHVRADTAYLNDTLPDEGKYDSWRVCVTDPVEGTDVTVDTWVNLELTHPDNGCPEPGKGEDGKTDLPDRDDDGSDYRDPFPSDRSCNSTFPNGFPASPGSSSDGGGGGWRRLELPLHTLVLTVLGETAPTERGGRNGPAT
ncbi:hypothetical protein [Streptomyces bobili]